MYMYIVSSIHIHLCTYNVHVYMHVQCIYSISMSIKCHHTVTNTSYCQYSIIITVSLYCGVELTSTPITCCTFKTIVELL